MDKNKTVRIGFVGVGTMGQCAHLRNYCAIPGCEVAALSELREKTAAKVARRYNVPKVYADYREMLEKEHIDAIVAPQQFFRHGILLPELIGYEKPIFIEKPLAGSVEAGEKILESLARSNTWIMVGYHKRSDPACAYALETINRFEASGEVGPLKYVRIIMPPGEWINNGFLELIDEKDHAPNLENDPPASDMDKKTFEQFTAFANYYIHQINLLRFFLGEPYHVVYADPTGVLFVGRSESGIPCVIEMAPYRTTVDWQESALIAYEKGYIKIDIPAPLALNRPGKVEILLDPGNGAEPRTVVPHLPWIHAMRRQAMNFIAAVRGEINPPCEAAEALEDLKIARDYIFLLKGLSKK